MACTAGFWALPRRAINGHIIAWFGTCTNIQEQRQMREQLKAAYSDLEAKGMFRMLDLEHEVKQLREAAGKQSLRPQIDISRKRLFGAVFR